LSPNDRRSEGERLSTEDLLRIAAEAATKANRQSIAPLPSPWPFTPLDARRAILEPPPAIRWHVENILLRGRAHAIAGLGGSSKTRLQVQIAIGTIAGQMLFPWVIPAEAQGPAILMLAEDTEPEARRAIYAIARALQLGPRQAEAMAKDLEIYPLAGEHVELLRLSPEGALYRTELFGSLAERAKTIGARYIGLDPGIRFTEGDEIDNRHQRTLGDTADALAIATDTCVVLNMHAAKALREAEELLSHSSRGGGALTDALRGELVLQTMTRKEAHARGIADETERQSLVQLRLVKANHAPPEAFAPMWLRRTDHGVLVAAEDLPQPQEGAAPAKDNRALGALRVLWDIGKGAHVKVADWREACLREGIITAKSEEAQAKALKRMAVALLDDKLLLTQGRGKGTTYAPRQTAIGPGEFAEERQA
jgi:hypothetical protein